MWTLRERTLEVLATKKRKIGKVSIFEQSVDA